jgi:hypothetical protein
MHDNLHSDEKGKHRALWFWEKERGASTIRARTGTSRRNPLAAGETRYHFDGPYGDSYGRTEGECIAHAAAKFRAEVKTQNC